MIPVSGGDYIVGDATKDLLWRRIVTPKGGFIHLPDYGAGISPKVLMSKKSLDTVKRQIEMSAAEDPRISSARAKIEVNNSFGHALISLSVLFETGESASMQWEVTDG